MKKKTAIDKFANTLKHKDVVTFPPDLAEEPKPPAEEQPLEPPMYPDIVSDIKPKKVIKAGLMKAKLRKMKQRDGISWESRKKR